MAALQCPSSQSPRSRAGAASSHESGEHGGPGRAIDAKGASLQLVLRKGMAKKVSNPKKTANTMQLFENYENNQMQIILED